MLTDGESSSQSAPSDRFERLLRLAARTSLSLPREETLATLLRLWEAAEAAEKPALLQRALLLATCDVALRPLAAALLRELVLEGAAEYVARDPWVWERGVMGRMAVKRVNARDLVGGRDGNGSLNEQNVNGSLNEQNVNGSLNEQHVNGSLNEQHVNGSLNEQNVNDPINMQTINNTINSPLLTNQSVTLFLLDPSTPSPPHALIAFCVDYAVLLLAVQLATNTPLLSIVSIADLLSAALSALSSDQQSQWLHRLLLAWRSHKGPLAQAFGLLCATLQWTCFPSSLLRAKTDAILDIAVQNLALGGLDRFIAAQLLRRFLQAIEPRKPTDTPTNEPTPLSDQANSLSDKANSLSDKPRNPLSNKPTPFSDKPTSLTDKLTKLTDTLLETFPKQPQWPLEAATLRLLATLAPAGVAPGQLAGCLEAALCVATLAPAESGEAATMALGEVLERTVGVAIRRSELPRVERLYGDCLRFVLRAPERSRAVMARSIAVFMK